VVLSCEHAAWTAPPDVDLGVTLDVLRSQASWDHGALAIATIAGDALGLSVHAGAFSRMFVDLNRPADHADVVPLISYGAPVPGNVSLPAHERARRIELFHSPYWAAVRREVAARLADRGAVLHVASHSFDPALDPLARTFDVGVLYDPDHALEAALAERLLFRLRAHRLDVRANQPYTGVGAAICTSLRRELGANYAGIQLEASHALTHTPGGCERVGGALAEFLGELQP
jgi:predicted N-formylglutamate amidohydrolase